MKWFSWLLMSALAAVFLVAGPALAQTEAALTGTYWRAVEIDGKPAAPQPQKQEAHLVFSAEGKRVSGSTGCNRVTGTYEQTGAGFRFARMASTKMACPPPLNAQEWAFLQALKDTAALRLSGNTLELTDASGKVRLRLEACPR